MLQASLRWLKEAGSEAIKPALMNLMFLYYRSHEPFPPLHSASLQTLGKFLSVMSVEA